MLLAGIQNKSLDACLRGHGKSISDTHLCGAVLSTAGLTIIPPTTALVVHFCGQGWPRPPGWFLHLRCDRVELPFSVFLGVDNGE